MSTSTASREAEAAGTPQDVASLLVETKLTPPRLRDGVVRPRIGQSLHAGAESVLTLVGAPAGYGKTTAVRQWCATQEAALAWVTVDTGDNDPTRMWRYIATAVDRIRAGLGQPALRCLGVGQSRIDQAVDELMNALSRYDEPVILVLDDLHAVTDRDCLESIDYALMHSPGNVRVIVSGRADPALGLPRLRAAQELAEVRASDLAFTSSEARALLVDGAGVELSDGQVDVLVKRTEGWPAALVLAGLWLRTVDDTSSAVARFGGDQHFVADYLSTEVLAALDEDHRTFLQGLAVLGQFTPEMSDRVFDRDDSAEELVELERANLFVSRLERGDWYSVHSLFAEYAKAQLEASDPGASSRIHMRAATWLRERRRPIDAIAHASAAGEHEVVGELLAEQHLALVRAGAAGRTLLHWTRTLPDEVLIAHPEVAVAAAIMTVIMGSGTMERRRYLGLVDRAHAVRPEARDTYVGCATLACRTFAIEGGVGPAVTTGRRAVELAEAEQPQLAGGALAAYARALYYAGDLPEAKAAALRALELPQITSMRPSLIHVHSTLALVAVAEERLAMARIHAEQARELVGRLGSSRSWLGANASAAMGLVLDAECEPAEAERELVTAEHFFRDDAPTLHHGWLLVLIARVRARRGRLDQATEALRRARDTLAEIADAGVLPQLIAAVERELDLANTRASTGGLVDTPSESELAVLRLMATDLSTREIGEHLFLSVNTVRSHRRALYRKLSTHSRTAAIARASALGLLEQAELPS